MAILFQKTCGNCKYHEKLSHGPKELYFRCKSTRRLIHLKLSQVKDGAFFNAVPFMRLFQAVNCEFWEQNLRGLPE